MGVRASTNQVLTRDGGWRFNTVGVSARGSSVSAGEGGALPREKALLKRPGGALRVLRDTGAGRAETGGCQHGPVALLKLRGRVPTRVGLAKAKLAVSRRLGHEEEPDGAGGVSLGVKRRVLLSPSAQPPWKTEATNRPMVEPPTGFIGAFIPPLIYSTSRPFDGNTRNASDYHGPLICNYQSSIGLLHLILGKRGHVWRASTAPF